DPLDVEVHQRHVHGEFGDVAEVQECDSAPAELHFGGRDGAALVSVVVVAVADLVDRPSQQQAAGEAGDHQPHQGPQAGADGGLPGAAGGDTHRLDVAGAQDVAGHAAD